MHAPHQAPGSWLSSTKAAVITLDGTASRAALLAATAWCITVAHGQDGLLAQQAGAQSQVATEEWGQALQALRPRSIGPAVMSGRIVDLAVVESDPIKFYVASATGGVYKTGDNGITLNPVFEHEGTHSVGAIAVHQVDTGVVWVGTGERANRQSSSWGDGVYKSVDGGTSWEHVGLADSHHIGRIALHPTNPDVVFVAAMGRLWGPNRERGLYKSVDGGATWVRILAVDDDTGVVDVALDPANPDVVYAATYQRRRRPWGFHGGGPGSGLHKSVDGGATWTPLSGPDIQRGLPTGIIGRIGISVYRADPRIVYASVEQGYRYNASTAYTERRAGIYRSEDHGESWTHMSDWNPRPMYASQILVDPNDDQRVYMVNSYSFSDDGGRTFTVPPQSLHGDDRLVWVNPRDSRHVMKADDGGVGISYDRGLHWLYISDLPVSQYYRVAVDMATPYNIYGGLQDNGSWVGPSETYSQAGIVNSDWVKIGGGDGFLNLPDTTNNVIVYTASQYLGLSRFDRNTGERVAIRPGDPEGHIAARRNWETWRDVGSFEEQRLGGAMAPANWDGPFVLSPHDASTLYAGTNALWRTRDRGDSWESLGDLTTGVDRRTLAIMGELPDEEMPSLDDGIPYYPTLAAIAESPLQEGVLYVGTDDGRFLVSVDGGARWRDAGAPDASDSDGPSRESGFPGLPPGAWVSGIEPSRHEQGRVYAVWNNYRNNDFDNYLYRSDDYGRTWVSIAGDLPGERVLRTVREDPRNPAVLFLGAEIGLFYTIDGGQRWTELRGGMPTLAFNDLVIHPRDNDLVMGTHGRGVWILDQINALQELTAEVLESEAHLFSMEPAVQVRRSGAGAHTGDIHFRGDNPPNGAIIDYWLGTSAQDRSVAVVVLDAQANRVAAIDGTSERGINRVVWDLRHEWPAAESQSADGGRPRRGGLVIPGTYSVRLEVTDASATTVTWGPQPLVVRPDPRINATPGEQRAWTLALLELASLHAQSTTQLERVREALEQLPVGADAGERASRLQDLEREWGELASRLARLAGAMEGAVAPPTQDQRSRREYLVEMLEALTRETDDAIR